LFIAIRPRQRLAESVDRGLVRQDFLRTSRKRRQCTKHCLRFRLVRRKSWRTRPRSTLSASLCLGRMAIDLEVEAADKGFHLLERRFVRHQFFRVFELARREPLCQLEQPAGRSEFDRVLVDLRTLPPLPTGTEEILADQASVKGFHLLERRFVRHQFFRVFELARREPLCQLEQRADLKAFFDTYISPLSAKRAKLAVLYRSQRLQPGVQQGRGRGRRQRLPPARTSVCSPPVLSRLRACAFRHFQRSAPSSPSFTARSASNLALSTLCSS
jgi:hypothetical protein